MKKAKSMYLIGEIVSADQCDYESSRKLGLVCPFCNEVVFLRASSMRETTLRNGKRVTQEIPSYFAHYPSTFNGFECENRALTKEGKAEIEKLVIESKNQRLKLFNDSLWDIFKSDRNVREKKVIERIKTQFSLKEIEDISSRTHRYFGTDLPKLYEFLSQLPDEVKPEKMLSKLFSIETVRQSVNDHYAYFDNVSLEFHLEICREIIAFLATRSSGRVFYNLIKVSLFAALAAAEPLTPEIIKDIKKVANTPYQLSWLVVGHIFNTYWINAIKNKV